MLTSTSELSQDFIIVSKRTHHLQTLWAFVVYRVRHMCDIPYTRGFWSGLECPKFGAVEGSPGQRGLITSRQDSRRGSVVQHAEGGINSSLIATEGGFGVIHILPPSILPSPLNWNLFKTGAPTYVPWGFTPRRLSHPSRVNRENDAQVASGTGCGSRVKCTQD